MRPSAPHYLPWSMLFGAALALMLLVALVLLELDLVLQRYLQRNPEDAELGALLELPDNDLWDIVSGRSNRYDGRFAGIVARLRAT